MVTLKKLRLLIAISWIIYVCQVLSIQFYDPTLYSPILHLSKFVVDRAINLNATFYFVLVFEATLLIYSSAALWLGHQSGKWAYTIYVVFALVDNYFLPVQAFSSLDFALQNMSFLLLGIILLALYISPLKEELAVKKSFNVWRVLVLFFIFFMLFFALPLLFSHFL